MLYDIEFSMHICLHTFYFKIVIWQSKHLHSAYYYYLQECILEKRKSITFHQKKTFPLSNVWTGKTQDYLVYKTKGTRTYNGNYLTLLIYTEKHGMKWDSEDMWVTWSLLQWVRPRYVLLTRWTMEHDRLSDAQIMQMQ